MNCERTHPLLSAYLDGELDSTQQAQVAAHLATCQECARMLDDFRALGQEVRALPDVPVPAGMREEFGTRLHKQRRSAFPGFGTRLLASGASAVVLVAVLIALAVGMSAVLRRMRAIGQVAKVVATYPLDGATDVPVNANLTLTFGRPMDRVSVEAAFHVVPETQLAFAWQGETLTVVPFADWRPATPYTLTVAGTARTIDGTSLVEPVVLRFATGGETLAELLTPIGRFGHIWRAEFDGPGGPLGYATAVEQELWCARQHFEHGTMMWLDQLREDHIYVLAYGADETSGTWQQYVDAWREGDPASGGLTPPERLFEPIRGFGRLWREELGGPEAPVGWALELEQGYTGNVQPFEHGLMLWNPLDELVYVLWDDFTWAAYPTLR